MATPLSHLAVPLALTAALGPDIVPPGLMALALVCAVLPDLDALGLWLGIPYEHPFGHRGITHSLPFAVALAGAGTLLAPALGADPLAAFAVLLVSAASHGLIDALTNGGLGIALFSPFSHQRVFPAVAGDRGVAAAPVRAVFKARPRGAALGAALGVGAVSGGGCSGDGAAGAGGSVNRPD